MLKKFLVLCLAVLLLTGCGAVPEAPEHEAYKPWEETFHERNSIYEAQYDVVISNPFPETCEYEIPEKYQEDVYALIDLIENSNEEHDYYTFYFTEEDEIYKIEEYLRLYYSDGYDILYPDYGCSCLFFHSSSHYEEDGYYIETYEIDLEHARECKAECIEWKETCIAMKNYLDNVVNELDLNGYVVHDLKEVHDYICKVVDYDYEFTNPYHGFSLGMVNGKTLICQGYADAMNLICKHIGLECYVDGGLVGGIGHAWNYVIINDNTYYIDTTWDDYIGGYDYEYFLVSREFMESTGHEFDENNKAIGLY